VTSDVVFESHPAIVTVTSASSDRRTDRYREHGAGNSDVRRGEDLKRIETWQRPTALLASGIRCAVRFVHTVRQRFAEAPSALGAAMSDLRALQWKFFQRLGQERRKPGRRTVAVSR